ncbi:MAG: hypothetical protein H6873_08015 [Hyphomicrobiaceae bacterium]|nr:hypothetical protein [Hyphomicrobiaceae bacterium]
MSKDNDRETLRQSITDSLHAGAKPKDVLKLVKKQFPKTKSKDLALAAFSLMIEMSESNAEAAASLQEIGLNARKGAVEN